ncbi:NUDIX domain-containing protein [Streptomyces sindenensis]|uniref:NUDIX domain-containing protein n=1 Tax=Streptomyces sindenensis TaxID=67363 RepID=UPI00369302B6
MASPTGGCFPAGSWNSANTRTTPVDARSLPRGALPMLPGGTVEKTDVTPEATLHREAAEEARLPLTEVRPFARMLATPAQAAALRGWGPPGERQAQLAAETARERWGLPAARAAAVEEIPTEGVRLS